VSERDCGGDAAAYALGALDRDEAEAFREHLDTCPDCRDDLAAFDAVVDQLPMAAPQRQAPRSLRRRVRRALREPRPRARTVSRPALALATSLAVAAAIVGGIALSSSGSSHARVIQASVIGSSGEAKLRLAGSSAELIVHGFPAPPAGKIYEVWLRRAASRPSPTSALFSVTSSGAADVEVPGDLHGVSEILVTPEPAGGSKVPTHSAVIVARVSRA
jgi:Anti-sigma-K factor rskA/Putative zinc-finger